MYAIVTTGKCGRMMVSNVSWMGLYSFGYNTKVWKSLRGVRNALNRIRANMGKDVTDHMTVIECDACGKEITKGGSNELQQ